MLFRTDKKTPSTTKSSTITRQDSLREVKLESGQVIGHVATDPLTSGDNSPLVLSDETNTSHLAGNEESLTQATSGNAESMEVNLGSLIQETVAAAKSDPNVTSAQGSISLGSAGQGQQPMKVVHLNPEQLKELNINLPNMETAEGPIQVYIIEEPGASQTGSQVPGHVTGNDPEAHSIGGQEVVLPDIIHQVLPQPSIGSDSQNNALLDENKRTSGEISMPKQKSAESGFHSMDEFSSGNVSSSGSLGKVRKSDSGDVTEETTLDLPSVANQNTTTNISQSKDSAVSGLVHSQPERDAREDDAPPAKRRIMESSSGKPKAL